MKKIFDVIRENKGLITASIGIGATVAGVIMLKKASLKCDEIIAEHKHNEEIIDFCTNEDESYTDEMREKDIEINKVNTAISIIKTYAAPYTTITIGGCMTMNGVYNTVKKMKNREV